MLSFAPRIVVLKEAADHGNAGKTGLVQSKQIPVEFGRVESARDGRSDATTTRNQVSQTTQSVEEKRAQTSDREYDIVCERNTHESVRFHLGFEQFEGEYGACDRLEQAQTGVGRANRSFERGHSFAQQQCLFHKRIGRNRCLLEAEDKKWRQKE